MNIQNRSIPLLFLLGVGLLATACSQDRSSGSVEHGDLSLFKTFCTQCHSAEQVMGKDRSLEEWKAVTRKMSERRFEKFGEEIPDEDMDKIIRYLDKEDSR